MSETIADPSTYPAALSIGPDDEFLVAKAQSGGAFALYSVTPSVLASFLATIIGTVQGVAGPAGAAGAAGSQIYALSTAPADSFGNNGDYYINIATGIMYGPKSGGVWPGSSFSFGGTGPQGPAGNAGAAGAAGTRGSLWYVGSGNPSGISGALANDEYLDAATGNVWTYSGTTWTETGNIRGPAGTNGTNGSNANLASLTQDSTLALTDFLVAVIGGTPAQIEVSNFLSDVGTNVSALSAAAAAAATDTVITLQGGVALLQTLSAMWTYFGTQVPQLRTGVIEVTANLVLDGSVHNDKILICSQPVTISPPVTFLGSGLTCQILNLSSGVVTLGGGIVTSSGVQTIPVGQGAELTSYTYSGGNGYYASISGGAGALTGSGLSVGTVANSCAVGAAIGIVGSVGPSGTAVQVAIGNSATAAPSTGWAAATVSGTGFTASITEGTGGTYYIWARQTANTAVQAVSGAVSVYTAAVAITSAPSSGSTGFGLSASGTVSPSGTAVQIGLSSSATVPPTSWTAATVTSGTWSGSVTPSAAGTFYLWAEQTGNSAITAVSGAITVAVAAVTITAPPSAGTVGTALNLAGTLAPSGAAVNVGLSTSNTTPPSSWTAATVSGTGWTASITPSAAGTFYLWAELTADTAVTAVSGAVTISAGAPTLMTFSYIAGSGPGGGGATDGTNLTPFIFTATGVNQNTQTPIVHSAGVNPCMEVHGPNPTNAQSAVWWFDASATNTSSTAGSVVSGTLNSNFGIVGGAIFTWTGSPAPATPGTYYGKVAFYSGAGGTGTLMGVYVTQAITVT